MGDIIECLYNGGDGSVEGEVNASGKREAN